MRSLRLLVCVSVLGTVLGACGSGSSPGEPTVLTLQNDNYAGGAITFEGWFDTGDGLGAVFPARSSAYSVRKVRFLFGGGGTAQTVTMTLSSVARTGLRVPLHTQDYPLTPSNALQEIDLSGAGVAVPAARDLWVEIIFQHAGFPGPAIDSNGRTAGRNWLFVGVQDMWRPQEEYVVNGDWIVRVEIEQN